MGACDLPRCAGLERGGRDWVVDSLSIVFAGTFERSGFFDVFEAAEVTFWSILVSFWEAVAPWGHLLGPCGARVTESSKFYEKVT